jgi:hypothetical protein
LRLRRRGLPLLPLRRRVKGGQAVQDESVKLAARQLNARVSAGRDAQAARQAQALAGRQRRALLQNEEGFLGCLVALPRLDAHQLQRLAQQAARVASRRRQRRRCGWRCRNGSGGCGSGRAFGWLRVGAFSGHQQKGQLLDRHRTLHC